VIFLSQPPELLCYRVEPLAAQQAILFKEWWQFWFRQMKRTFEENGQLILFFFPLVRDTDSVLEGKQRY
jgi:hypothetical protein